MESNSILVRGNPEKHCVALLTCGVGVEHAVHGVNIADLPVLLFGALLGHFILFLVVVVADGRVARVQAERAGTRTVGGSSVITIAVVVVVAIIVGGASRQ